MIKRTLRKLTKSQEGQVLPIVLVLLALGGLLLVPTLNHASTSLKGNQVTETKTKALFAADAGVEKAIWKLQNDDSPSCNLADINGMDITVTKENEESVAEGTLYTIRSKATKNGETKEEVIAQLLETQEVHPIFKYAMASNDGLILYSSTVDGDIYAQDITLRASTVKGDAEYTEVFSSQISSVEGDIIKLDEPIEFPGINEEKYKNEADPGTPYYDGDVRILYGQVESGPEDILDGNRIMPYHIGGDFTIQGGNADYRMGPLYVEENLTIRGVGVITLEGSVYSEGSISIQASQLTGSESVVAGGDITLQVGDYDSENIPFILSTEGDITCQTPSTIGAVVYAPDGKIALQADVDIYGAVIGEEECIGKGNTKITYATELENLQGLPGGETTGKIVSWSNK